MMRRACHDQPQQDLHCSDLGEQVVLVIAFDWVRHSCFFGFGIWAIEAFDNRHVGFQGSDQIAQPDGFRVMSQADAPALALAATDVAELGQGLTTFTYASIESRNGLNSRTLENLSCWTAKYTGRCRS